jgi:PEP-CTERM motif
LRFLLCLLLLSVPDISTASTIDFSELGFGGPVDVDGLHRQGVQFEFSPGQAVFNGTVGTLRTTVWSIDPVLVGPATGILTIGFDVPTPVLSFDLVLQSIFAIDDSAMGPNGGPAYTVLLSTGTSISGSTAPQPSGIYSEGQFQYAGVPITSATITFFNGMDSGGMAVASFGLDNLTFGAPEPATVCLLGAGLLSAGLTKRYARRQR